jgi:alpha-tubulin suppressor-like RCC1 family protein
LQWFQNGAPVASGTNELLFDRALPQHGGSYRLVASGALGSVTSSVAQIPFSRVVSWGNVPGTPTVDFSNVVAVAAGYTHALGIRPDGTVGAWGSSGPATNVPSGLSNVTAVAAGNGFSVALRSDGRVVSWGTGPTVKTNPPLWLSNVVAIAAGGDHSLALRSDGTVVGWGINDVGQTNIPPDVTNVVAIAAGSRHSLALRSDGTVQAWGLVLATNSTAVGIAAGYEQSLILQADGTVRAWTPSGQSAGVPAGLSNVVAVSAGGSAQGFVHAVALKSDGSLVAWGNNSFGQINVPSNIVSAVALSAGGNGTLAYLNDRSPVVTAQTAGRRVARGTNVTLAALAVGQPVLNYQWRFKGVDMPGATNATLTLTGVDHSFSGGYAAVVSNVLGVANSQTMLLQVGGGLILVSPNIDLNRIVSYNVAEVSGSPLGPADLPDIGAQVSSNLVNWETLTGALVYTNGTIRLRDVSQTNRPTRFYRVFEQ